MSIFETLQGKLQNAIKTRNLVAANIYRIVIGECQTRNKFDDKFVLGYIKSVIKSNDETVSLGAPAELAGKLNSESEFLRIFLPKVYTIQEVLDSGALDGLELTNKSPQNEAKGLVMKKLAAQGIQIDGRDLESLIEKVMDNGSEGT